MGDWQRPLTTEELRVIALAREKAFLLYEGRVTPHRSCGIAMAETFGRPSASYQALRRGGITGGGACGVLVGGRLLLGEIFGDPDPTGPVTEALRTAIDEYDARYAERIDRGRASGDSIVCNKLTAPFEVVEGGFRSPQRAAFCTNLAAEAAALVAEVALRNGHTLEITPIDVAAGPTTR